MLSLRLSVLVLLATTAACSASSTTGNVFTTSSGEGGAGSTGAGGKGGEGGAGSTTTGEGGGDFTTGVGGGGTGGGEMLVAEVWGQSPDTLYKLDPKTNAVTTIGKFQGCGSSGGVIDIAVDKDSVLYAATSNGLYTVDKTSAQCALIASGTYPNSLSFVPAGTVDPNVEALVGYNGATYIRIDPKSGQVTTIGQLSNGYTSSGDVVSVKGKTYLTANGVSCTKGDCLLEINPKTGDVVKNWGSVGYDAVYGLAFWAGKAYGFTDGGDLFEISFTPTGITETKISIPGSLKLQFWGAGSTTVAPPNTVPQ
jgi:hypothetical protein